jgi:membrane fusion protein, multidrug efflux system
MKPIDPVSARAGVHARIASPLVALLAAAVLAACGSQASPGDGAPPAPQVSVATVVAEQVRQWDDFTGRVQAVQSVELRPRVSGYVERVAFTEGADVRMGDLLFVIDPRPYRAALAQAEAQLARARSEALLANAQNARAQALVDARAISREEFETRNAATAQGNAAVRAAEAAVTAARLNLQYTEVRAPIDGRVGRALVTVGNLAQADATLLSTVVSQDPVHVHFEADERTWLRYARQARDGEGNGAGNAVRVGLSSDEGYPHVGTVDFIDNHVDPATGTIRARAVLRNPDGLFTPGLFARVQLQGSQAIDALLVDDKAVLTDQDRKYVYVLGEGDVAERRDVVLGPLVDGLRVVEQGLAPGDRVIVNGLQKVFMPGMPVAPETVAMRAPLADARVAAAGAGVK